MREGVRVFQRVWAAFTLAWAVGRVKGGVGGGMCVGGLLVDCGRIWAGWRGGVEGSESGSGGYFRAFG